MHKITAFFIFLIGVITPFFGVADNKNNVELSENNTVKLKVLGINDFHGQIPHVEGKGGLLALGSHLIGEIEAAQSPVFVLHAGDHVGASPAESGLLQDEPAISFLNTVQSYCDNDVLLECHVIGTAGNHEFDEGTVEMMRLLNGGVHSSGPFLEKHWKGANYTTLSANVIKRDTGQLLLKPYVIHAVQGVDIGFIGITLDSTPKLLVPGTTDDLTFLSQIDALDHYSRILTERGVNAQILIVHDGTAMNAYPGITKFDKNIPKDSRFYRFVSSLPPSVDLVVTGHSHKFTNAYVKTQSGKSVLVTQAYASGKAYADINVTLDKRTKDIEHATARILVTQHLYSGVLSDSAKQALDTLDTIVSQSHQYVERLTQRVLNTYLPTIEEPPLGRFLADSHKVFFDANLGVINRGGIRATLEPGVVTWGDLFNIQPFSNSLVLRVFKGQDLLDLVGSNGLYWSTNLTTANDGSVFVDGQPIDSNMSYLISGNEFLMSKELFLKGKLISKKGKDVDATADYIEGLPSPFSLIRDEGIVFDQAVTLEKRTE